MITEVINMSVGMSIASLVMILTPVVMSWAFLRLAE